MCWPQKPGVPIPLARSSPKLRHALALIGDSAARVHGAAGRKVREPGFKPLQRRDAASKAILVLL